VARDARIRVGLRVAVGGCEAELEDEESGGAEGEPGDARLLNTRREKSDERFCGSKGGVEREEPDRIEKGN
jgi:hypothetical protein